MRMLSFKDYSKVLLRLSKVTDELHDIDKMTGGEFSKMDRKDSSADHTPIGSSELRAEKSKERKIRFFRVLNYHHQMLMVRARSNALSSEIPR